MGNILTERTRKWWSAKAGFLISVLSCHLAAHAVGWQSGLWLLCLTVAAILAIGTFGHFINDWTDIEEDRRAGKPNPVSRIGLPGRVVIPVLLLLLSFLPWLIGFASDGVIVGLVSLQLLLFVLYSVPPVRLKRFPAVAAATDALYAYVNPAIFFWLTFALSTENRVSMTEVLLLTGWTLPMGLRHILNHHAADMDNDRLSGTPNLAVLHSPASLLRWTRVRLIPFEILFGAAFLFTVTAAAPMLRIAVLCAYAAVLLFSRSGSFPYTGVRLGKLLLDTFSMQWLGIIALSFLTCHQWQYGLALIGFLVMFTGFFRHPVFSVLPLLAGRSAKALSVILKWPFRMLSLIFNWSLYCFRRWILNWSEERNWGEHHAKRMEDAELDKMGNVAVFNQNPDKSSETFVRGQLARMPNRTSFFHGWPKPMVEMGRVHLTDANSRVRDLIYGFLTFTDSDTGEFDDNRIADRLLASNVKLIVAHFGPMGVALTDVARKTGIPLIVIFHGYDAWNRKQLEEHSESYRELFRTASCVVGVSRDICRQLERLGCSPDKIEHLPAYMDLSLFRAEERKEGKAVFLYVGRFSKTKSPMLVIMAFHRVLERMPDAELVMVGHDDGEGLYESCLMLAKALRAEHRIDFKGTLSHTEVHREMEKASIFVQHSVTTPIGGDREGTPVGIMEAMAMGLPIIATDHAGIAEMIVHGETGILVKEYDMHAMAEEMIRLGLDPGQRGRLGRNAAQAIRKNEKVMNNTERFLTIVRRNKLKR